MEVNYFTLGQKIRQERLRMKWTQEKFAERINKSPKHVSGIENATTKVSLSTLMDIANALDTTLDYLLVDNMQQKEVIFEAEIAKMLEGHSQDVMERLTLYIKCFFDMHLEE